MVAYETNAAELKRTIHELHTNAMEAEKEKRAAEASGCWSRMADCFRLLAKMETNMMECARLHQKALRCSARAGNSPNAKSQAEAAPNDADDLDKLVAGLIYPRSEVSWDDIGGMEQAKHDLKYAIGLLLARRPEELKHLEIPLLVYDARIQIAAQVPPAAYQVISPS